MSTQQMTHAKNTLMSAIGDVASTSEAVIQALAVRPDTPESDAAAKNAITAYAFAQQALQDAAVNLFRLIP